MRSIEITRQEGSWLALPWTAFLYEDGNLITCACASTRKGAIRSLRNKVKYLEQPKPKIVHRESIPYGELSS